MSNHVDNQYQRYLQDILQNGYDSSDRTGTGTTKAFGRQLRFDLTEGFPLLTTKQVWFEGVARELLWFLRGLTNVRHLEKNGVSIWTPNAYSFFKNYHNNPLDKEEFAERLVENKTFAETWGDMGEIYGKQWRNSEGFDQIANLVEQLPKNPDSRRLRVSAWRPRIHMKGAPDQIKAVLPPCHVSFQVFTRKRKDGRRGLSLKWNQRTVDSFLGLPFNVASYGLLTHLLAHRVDMVPEDLIFHGGDCHIYNNHTEQVERLLNRNPKEKLPTVSINREEPPEDMGDYRYEDFELSNYEHHSKIKAPIAT